MPESRFTRDHVLSRDAYVVGTNVGDYVSLDYDGVSHPVNLNTRLLDGSAAFPRIDLLTKGIVIRVTYSLPLGADPLVSSLAPKIVSLIILGPAPLYELIVQTYPATSSELADPNHVTRRVQDKLQDQATVVGIRRLA